ncbi:aldo/keto reductase [Stigmatella hybrida]|uniref:aldo/keto reductase n=1 Tax=Stigmatella hybrida TaxID=394097 RepID=UPI001CDB06D3|nr:aldo/keto reductase [Stigmatella hybrida]
MSRFHRRAFLHASGLTLAATAAGRVWAAPPETPRMLTRPIPSTQEPLPVIGMGTWQTFDVGPDAAEQAPLEEVLRTFVALGGTLVDSSPMYGRSEEVVGTLAVKTGLQPKLFLATKVWTSGKAEGIRQMEDSLRKLRAQRVDLMEVHNLVDAATHLDTLRAWKEEGRVRYVGVTHYTASAHDAVAKLLQSRKVDFVQINYSVGEREAEQRLLSVARERGVAVIANRPFAGGGLLQRLKHKPLPPWAAELDCESWAQLLLKFVISHPAVTCAIPATSKPSHLRDNMKAGLGRLPDEKLRARIAAEAA